MKIFFCLFETPFEIQKNGVFLFEISFFISEILRETGAERVAMAIKLRMS